MQTPLVRFSEKEHAYIDRNNNKLLSVSGFIKKYEEEFDSEMIATRKVFRELNKPMWDTIYLKHNNDPYLAIEEMRKYLKEKDYSKRIMDYQIAWADKGKASSERGTYHHKKFETDDYERGYSVNPYNKKKYIVRKNEKIPAGFENCSLHDNLFDLEDGYYPEMLIFNECLKLAGQSDKVYIETVGNDRFVDIDDYKFVNEILMVPAYFDRKLKKFPSMKEPISHIYQTNYYSYALKISTYAWMMERFGFKIRNLGLRQMVELLNKEFIELPYEIQYRKKEILLLVKDFFKNNCIE